MNLFLVFFSSPLFIRFSKKKTVLCKKKNEPDKMPWIREKHLPFQVTKYFHWRFLFNLRYLRLSNSILRVKLLIVILSVLIQVRLSRNSFVESIEEFLTRIPEILLHSHSLNWIFVVRTRIPSTYIHIYDKTDVSCMRTFACVCVRACVPQCLTNFGCFLMKSVDISDKFFRSI